MYYNSFAKKEEKHSYYCFYEGISFHSARTYGIYMEGWFFGTLKKEQDLMDFVDWRDWPHVLRTQQFSAEGLEAIIRHAQAFEEALSKNEHLPLLSRNNNGRNVSTIFYEPSTRTETTFRGAAERIGCNVHAIANPNVFSSAVKGESFLHAVAAFSRVGGLGDLRLTDCLIMRHGQKGAAEQASKVVDTANGDGVPKIPLPVINAGDGSGQHPTQAMVDLYVIDRGRRKRGHNGHPLDNITVLFSGDLKDSRTTNSLLHLLGKFSDFYKIGVIFCTHKDLRPDDGILSYLARHRIEYKFVPKLKEAVPLADVIYMTRIQRERKNGNKKYKREKFVFRAEYLDGMKEDAFLMHPLPINCDPNDPPPEIDDALTPLAMQGHPQLAYFQQSLLGLPVRAALLDLIFHRIDEQFLPN